MITLKESFEGLSSDMRYVTIEYDMSYQGETRDYDIDYYYDIPFEDFVTYVAENPNRAVDMIWDASKDEEEFDALLVNYITNNFDEVFKEYYNGIYWEYFNDAEDEMYRTENPERDAYEAHLDDLYDAWVDD